MAEFQEEIEQNASPCAFCGAKPKIIHYADGIWYAECSNTKCKQYISFQHLGLRKSIVLEKWEYVNRPIKRKQYNKSGENENNDI